MQTQATPTPARPRQPRQTVAAATIPDAQLLIGTVAEVTGRSTSTLYRLMAAGKFPQPIRHGKRCSRWLAADVMAWLRKQAVRAS